MDEGRKNEDMWPRPGAAPAGIPIPDPDPDPEWAAYVAWREREIAAGREDRVPDEWELEGPAVSISLGDAADIDPALLAAICGPDGLGGQSPQQFTQDRAADVLRPGPVLAALTEQAVCDPGRLSDDELVGVLLASRRLEAREAYKQVVLTAEFARRREAEFAAAARRGTAVGCRPGAFPGEELAGELLITRGEASRRIDTAADLATRLPATREGMAAGLIDAVRADVISFYTRVMDPADAARADEILATAAPGLRVEQLARRAAALEMKLAPDAARARKEHAKNTARRVEVRRELSGNACLAGREMDTADAMASYAYISAVAARLRAAGLAGPIGALRSIAMSDLTQGRDPLDRIGPASGKPASGKPASARPAPVPALVNITVPAGTLLGWSTAPAHAGTWGLLDHEEARAAIAATARHPATRFCFTLLGPDGAAVAHGCAPGPQPLTQFTDLADITGTPGLPWPRPPGSQHDAPTTRQTARIAELVRRMKVIFRPITSGNCDHAHVEDRYTPSRGLTHLIRARTATCTAPGCTIQAADCDLDHTAPYPHGPTCQCNMGPLCRTHHRAKQAPDWKIEQTTPGVFLWTLPSGRTHATAPTAYDV